MFIAQERNQQDFLLKVKILKNHELDFGAVIKRIVALK